MANQIAPGAPLSTLDIINDLNNPHSLLRQTVAAYITVNYNEAFLEQQQYLSMIQAERQQIREYVSHSSSSSSAETVNEKILVRLEPVPAKNQALLQKLQVQSQALDGLYQEYEKINISIREIKEAQREEYNTTVNKIGLDPQYHLTPEKQARLHEIFEETQKRSEKLREMTGKVHTEKEIDHLKELKFMKQTTETSHNHNLKPSEIRLLSKGKNPDNGKGLFQTFNESEKIILGKQVEREALVLKIQTSQAAMTDTLQQLQQNTAQLAPILTPNFSSARNAAELEEKLKGMYEAVEKVHRMSGSTVSADVSFQYRLDAQLKLMPSEERNEFFKKTEGLMRDPKQQHIASVLNDLREKYEPGIQQEAQSSKAKNTPKPTAPQPFDTTKFKPNIS